MMIKSNNWINNNHWKIVFCLPLCFPQIAGAHSLKEAVMHVLATGPEVQISKIDSEASQQALIQSYASYLPKIDANVTYGPETTDNSTTRSAGLQSRELKKTEASMSASQLVFDGFKTVNNIDKRRYNSRSKAFGVQGTINDAAFETIQAYVNVLKQAELLSLSEKNLKEHQAILARIKRRAESGLGRVADLDQAEGRFALSRTNFMSQQATYRDVVARYKKVVGLDPEDLSMPSFPIAALPTTEDSAVMIALNTNPDMKSSISDLNAAKAENRGAKGSYYPSLSVQWRATRNNDTGGSFGQSKSEATTLNMNYNLFNGGADKSAILETTARVNQSKESRDLERRRIEESVRNAWNTYTTAQAQLQYFKQHEAATEKTLDAYQKQFSVGQRTLMDLLDSENELFSARQSYINGKYQVLLGQYSVLNSMGKIHEVLDLPLPTQAYFQDPGFFGGVTQIINNK